MFLGEKIEFLFDNYFSNPIPYLLIYIWSKFHVFSSVQTFFIPKRVIFRKKSRSTHGVPKSRKTFFPTPSHVIYQSMRTFMLIMEQLVSGLKMTPFPSYMRKISGPEPIRNFPDPISENRARIRIPRMEKPPRSFSHDSTSDIRRGKKSCQLVGSNPSPSTASQTKRTSTWPPKLDSVLKEWGK